MKNLISVKDYYTSTIPPLKFSNSKSINKETFPINKFLDEKVLNFTNIFNKSDKINTGSLINDDLKKQIDIQINEKANFLKEPYTILLLDIDENFINGNILLNIKFLNKITAIIKNLIVYPIYTNIEVIDIYKNSIQNKLQNIFKNYKNIVLQVPTSFKKLQYSIFPVILNSYKLLKDVFIISNNLKYQIIINKLQRQQIFTILIYANNKQNSLHNLKNICNANFHFNFINNNSNKLNNLNDKKENIIFYHYVNNLCCEFNLADLDNIYEKSNQVYINRINKKIKILLNLKNLTYFQKDFQPIKNLNAKYNYIDLNFNLRLIPPKTTIIYDIENEPSTFSYASPFILTALKQQFNCTNKSILIPIIFNNINKYIDLFKNINCLNQVKFIGKNNFETNLLPTLNNNFEFKEIIIIFSSHPYYIDIAKNAFNSNKFVVILSLRPLSINITKYCHFAFNYSLKHTSINELFNNIILNYFEFIKNNT